jgi:hypothetical protein
MAIQFRERHGPNTAQIRKVRMGQEGRRGMKAVILEEGGYGKVLAKRPRNVDREATRHRRYSSLPPGLGCSSPFRRRRGPAVEYCCQATTRLLL